ncbi:DUF5336 domain-containing protein [Mycolicibacterium sp.]|uniref:DUF5336 domain-containing protein n=1 Tax=Mycolicibacterium sp. TaxID=2320850 RepID=UPI001A1A611D|nr:DUF5336 domain-containing protein [Mycolicibacterium sp.]MBJ7341863.1 DUF5336 domain-containing protein [Mycolicibacterium sp.]
MNYPPRPDRHGPPAFEPRPDHWFDSPRNASNHGLPFYATLGVVLLGVVGFFLGFAPYAKYTSSSEGDLAGLTPSTSINFFDNAGGGVGAAGLSLLLAAASIAAFGLLPRQHHNGPVIAGLSLAGSTTLLFLLVGLQRGQEAGVGLILVLVAACLQTVLAVTETLASAGVIRSGGTAYGYPQPSSPDFGRANRPGPYGPPSGPPDYRGGPYRPR